MKLLGLAALGALVYVAIALPQSALYRAIAHSIERITAPVAGHT